LLGKVTQQTLQLDNHFSSEHLCFIVSKTDSSLSMERYIKTHEDLTDALAPLHEKERKHISLMEQAKIYYAELIDTQATNQKILAETNRRVKEIVETSKEKKTAGSAQQKRKRDIGEVSASK